MARLSLLVGLEPWKNLRLLQQGFCKTSKKKIHFLTYDHHVNLTQAKNAVQCGFPMHHYCYRRQKNQVSLSVFTVSTNNVFCVRKTGVILCFYWMVFFFHLIKINPDTRSHWLRAVQVSVREDGLCPTEGFPVTGITRGGIVLGFYPKQLVNYKTSFCLHYTLCLFRGVPATTTRLVLDEQGLMAKAAVAQVVRMIMIITITIHNSCFRFTTELSTSGLQASFHKYKKT